MFAIYQWLPGENPTVCLTGLSLQAAHELVHEAKQKRNPESSGGIWLINSLRGDRAQDALRG